MNPSNKKRLLIVGASVRPLVFSAIKSGYRVLAFDYFSDWDTEKFLPRGNSLTRIQQYEDILKFSGWADCDAAVISGGVENRFQLMNEFEKRTSVLGTSSASLNVLADVPAVFCVLKNLGAKVPESRESLDSKCKPADWLLKNSRSAGGGAVRAVCASEFVAANSSPVARDVPGVGQDSQDDGALVGDQDGEPGRYFQRRVNGENLSVALAGTVGGARLVGISKQIVGRSELGASEFQYCGSVEAQRLTSGELADVHRIANVLVESFGVRGLFGFDFIRNSDGIWPIDINPRPTASMELFESKFDDHGRVKSLIDLHVQACEESQALIGVSKEGLCRGFFEAKVILFNRLSNPISISPSLAGQIHAMFERSFFESDSVGCSLADLPHTGEFIQVGHPILTVRARAKLEQEVEALVQEKSAEVYSLLEVSNG